MGLVVRGVGRQYGLKTDSTAWEEGRRGILTAFNETDMKGLYYLARFTVEESVGL